jgi:hypothetical protein
MFFIFTLFGIIPLGSGVSLQLFQHAVHKEPHVWVITTIRNVGTVPIDNVTITDSIDVGVVCEPRMQDNEMSTLKVGGSRNCVGVHNITTYEREVGTFSINSVVMGYTGIKMVEYDVNSEINFLGME